ncbi:hypothetical protein HMPREF9946_00458 [Acetobacteraceae bacterium AT-5844]|nr:hypothetical protein HMPREF9946_00458 [Acetobacteraceae bacterium AT-5844]
MRFGTVLADAGYGASSRSARALMRGGAALGSRHSTQPEGLQRRGTTGAATGTRAQAGAR